MKNQGNSMQSQNKYSQAQQSLDHLHNSAAMAQSHPTEEMIEQANHSLAKAQQAVEQAQRGEDNPGAARLVQSELQEEQENLQSLQ